METSSAESENILKLGCLLAAESRSHHLNHCADYMTTSYSQNTEPSPSGRLGVRLTKEVKIGAIVTLFLLLVAGNVLSLTHHASHNAGFQIVKNILGWVTPEDVAKALLSRSPTVIRDQQIKEATKVLQKERDDIANKYGKLNADHIALGHDHKKLEVAHKKLDADHRKLDAGHHKLAGDYRNLNSDHMQLQQREKQRAAIVHKVVEKAGERQARHALRSVASAPGKTIPVVGAALIAGATAWDIYDACELLNELDQLTAAFGNSSNHNHRQKVCGLPYPTQAGLLQRARANWEGVYEEAAKELQGLPRVSIPTVPQVPSLRDIKRSVCTVIGAVGPICP